MSLTTPPAPPPAPGAAPSRSNIATFAALADAAYAWFINYLYAWVVSFTTWYTGTAKPELEALQADVTTKQTAAATSATNAATSETNAASYASTATNAANVNGTSTSSITVGAGTKTFVFVEASRTIVIGMWLTVANTADVSKYMFGQVTAWNSGTKTVTLNATTIGGSGTFTAWTVSLSGGPGPASALTGTAVGTVDLLSGAAIASASTINLDTATGNRVHVTGTTTITAVTLTRGPRTVVFDGILTLTHHATNNNLPSGANITTAVGDRAIYESDGTTVYCIDYIKADGTAVKNLNPIGVPRLAKTGAYSLTNADKGSFVDCSGTFNLTFGANAAFDTDWHVWVSNSGTGNVTLLRSSTDTIDALTTYVVYPGELRRFDRSGSGTYVSKVLTPYAVTYTASGTHTKPPGYRWHAGELWSGGGSGSKSGSTTVARGGGAGGACALFVLPDATVNASETVTIGAGGVAVSTAVNGNAGGTSTFSIVNAYGGAGGVNGNAANGGSAFITGLVGGANVNHVFSAADSVSGVTQAYMGGVTSNSGSSTVAGKTVWGGACGGGYESGTPAVKAAGTTIFGGAGGADGSAGVGVAGTAPAGGGGATGTGANSGAGARGELRLRGIV